jgi:uncharacterized coiled-coil protein SlyX
MGWFSRKNKPEPGQVMQTVPTIYPHGGPMQPGQEVVAQAVAEFMGNTAISRISADVSAIVKRLDEQNGHMHALNTALGEFREKLVVPLREELKFLRYNLGDKVNHTVTDLDVMVGQLDKILWGALRASGMTDEQIKAYRTEAGMQPEAPRGFELEAQTAEREALISQVRTLVAQNQRLLALQGAQHVFWAQDLGQWQWHQGCECEACRAETVRVAAAQQEAAHGA